jgi:murein DD-endopeptidase MepM/ murein hydrolase activator NlpD
MKRFLLVFLSILAIFGPLAAAGCGSTSPFADTNGARSSPVPDTPAAPTPADTNELQIPTPTSDPTPETPATELPGTEPAENAPATIESCAAEACTESGFFLFDSPIGPGGRRTIDYTSRFGTYRKSTEAVLGAYFLNSSGTPVLAAAEGVVVAAGDDLQIPSGRYRGAYGNLVILEHDFPGVSVPVFTLYGHLSQVSVQVDDHVQAGDEIGLVGMSGDISGSTLYFEVRYGENSYLVARNPELWLKPLASEAGQSTGVLAGRIVDSDGNYLTIQNIILEQLAGPGQPAIDQFYLRTYSGESLMGLEPWEENFAAGGLPAGEYQISFLMDGMQQRVVEVFPDQVTFVTFEIE